MHPANIEADKERVVHIVYTEYGGTVVNLSIIPHQITFGHPSFNSKDRWLLTATDVISNEVRTFDMACIHSWST
jgi:hypothetical protein